MAVAAFGSAIVKQLIAMCAIPAECVNFTLSADVHSAVKMSFEIFVSEAQFQAIADAIRDNPEEAQRIAKTFLFRSRDRDSTAEVTVDESLAQGVRPDAAGGKP